ncbi:hypothetical protein Asera_48860 [Actinocatenispora sera]|uniref:Uncharacterized protein n=1 Tax=Actinocatenispora sera TaxID=390989 RepID=A0A810L9P0_9ACTN|nr:hypothetical protein Asera_48860 [Actinocatenispora sera]
MDKRLPTNGIDDRQGAFPLTTGWHRVQQVAREGSNHAACAAWVGSTWWVSGGHVHARRTPPVRSNVEDRRAIP